MNWIGGNLQRHSKGSRSEAFQRQKAHFAKVRSTGDRSHRTRSAAEDTSTHGVKSTEPHGGQHGFDQEYNTARSAQRQHRQSTEDSHATIVPRNSGVYTVGDTIEASRERLLAQSDWLGLKRKAYSPGRKMCYSPSTDRHRVGRRRQTDRVILASKNPDFIGDRSRPHADPQGPYMSGALPDDDFHIRIGSRAVETSSIGPQPPTAYLRDAEGIQPAFDQGSDDFLAGELASENDYASQTQYSLTEPLQALQSAQKPYLSAASNDCSSGQLLQSPALHSPVEAAEATTKTVSNDNQRFMFATTPQLEPWAPPSLSSFEPYHRKRDSDSSEIQHEKLGHDDCEAKRRNDLAWQAFVQSEQPGVIERSTNYADPITKYAKLTMQQGMTNGGAQRQHALPSDLLQSARQEGRVPIGLELKNRGQGADHVADAVDRDAQQVQQPINTIEPISETAKGTKKPAGLRAGDRNEIWTKFIFGSEEYDASDDEGSLSQAHQADCSKPSTGPRPSLVVEISSDEELSDMLSGDEDDTAGMSMRAAPGTFAGESSDDADDIAGFSICAAPGTFAGLSDRSE